VDMCCAGTAVRFLSEYWKVLCQTNDHCRDQGLDGQTNWGKGEWTQI